MPNRNLNRRTKKAKRGGKVDTSQGGNKMRVHSKSNVGYQDRKCMEHMPGIYNLLMKGRCEEQLFQEAGYHDFLKWGTINLHNAHSRLAGLHESLHDEFLTSTPFGAVQQAFVRVQKRSGIKYIIQQSKLWSEELAQQSALTHERAATYLSIKMFSPEIQQQLQMTLHPTYKSLFKDLQDIIDPIFKSSYLQYHVGYAFCELCFASTIAERLSKHDFINTPKLLPDEAPNNRFDILNENLTRDQLNHLLEYIIEDLDQSRTVLQLPSDFAVQSERSWLGLSHPTAVQIDKFVAKTCREWLYENSGQVLKYADLNDSSRFKVINHFFVNLKTATGIDILTQQDNSLQCLIANNDETPNQAGIAAIKYGKGVIENNPIIQTDKIPLITNQEQLDDFCNKEAEQRVLITESDKISCRLGSSWILLRFNKGEVEGARCSHIKLIELLKKLCNRTHDQLLNFVIVGVDRIEILICNARIKIVVRE